MDENLADDPSRRDILKRVGDGTNRREFLRSVATTSVGGGLAAALADRDILRPVRAEEGRSSVFSATDGDPDAVFPQSVSSGGPTESGVILWTRIAPEAYRPDADLGVEVATDEAFDDVAHRGVVEADAITADHDYTVKVDLDGELDSNAFYHYRFTYDGTRSRVGRCRTLPGPEDDLDSVSFGVVTCQHYQNGYYPAHHHLADEDVDYLIHLGDFIYETADDSYIPSVLDVTRTLELPSGEALPQDVDDYRALYNTYKRDRFLQEALESHTLIAGWDDHEVANDRYWDYAADAPAVPPYDRGEEFAVEITADAIQTWTEQIPARVEYDPSKDGLHEQFRLWREFSFGDLVDLAVTDERLYRDEPLCEEFELGCPGSDDPDRTMLGERQKEWFLEWASESEATWTVWQNEVLGMPLTMQPGDDVPLFHNSWAGYSAERDDIFETFADVDNMVTLTGDLHAAMTGYQQTSYPDGERVGVELMTPSVTSINVPDAFDLPFGLADDFFSGIAKLVNDHVEFASWYHHGYSVVEFTPEETTFSVYAVDKDVDSPDADRRLLTRQRIPRGEVRIDETPMAAFETSAREVAVGESIVFDASISKAPPEGSIASYEWTFDDGRSATGETVEHTFGEPGRYTVTLRATDGDGTADSTATRVTVTSGECSTAATETIEGTTGDGEDDVYTYSVASEDPCGVTVSLDGPEGTDLDLYLTYDGRRPTPWDHDEHSWSSGSQERIVVAEDALSPGTELGLLVDGRSGGDGEYELVVEERGR